MDPTNLPKGYYYDPIQGQIEDFTYVEYGAGAASKVPPNTIVMIGEVSRGYVGHDVVADDALNLYLCVGKAADANPNDRWVEVYKNPPGNYVFSGSPIAISQPVLKIDIVSAIKLGPHLLVSTTTHAPQEAPRPTYVEGTVFQNILTYIPPYVPSPEPRGGVCDPEQRPYFRRQNKLTRGQLCKIQVVSMEAQGYVFEPIAEGQQTFADVPPTDPFYEYIEKLASIEAIAGYPCEP